MAQSDSGIGNVTPNAELVQMAMSYSRILKNCRAVIPANGSLLVIEFILPPLISQADPHLGHLMSDLNMLAVTGGRERSEHEWRTLLEAAGFRLAGVFPVGNDVGSSKQSHLRRDCSLRPM